MRLALTLPVLMLSLAPLAGCGDDDGQQGATDTAADATVAEDTAVEDTAVEDTAPEQDSVEVCEHACLNEFGNNDKSLCPDPKSEWSCVAGCCEPVFRCQSDDDCAVRGFEEGHCSDDRYACHCDADAGTCFTWYCGGDGECGDGELCAAGSCRAAPATAGLTPRILDAPTVLVAGATKALHLDLVDPGDADVALAAPAGAVSWTSSDDDVAAVADGVVTGGATAGEATITATLDASGASATWAVRNVLVDADDTLTIIAVDDRSLAPLSAKVVVVPASGAAFISDLPADGVFRSDMALGDGVDVHVFADGHDWVSWLAIADATVIYLPVARTVFSRVDKSPEGNIVPETTILQAAGVVTGAPQDGLYSREGALELSLSSFALSTALFDFNLQVLLGADVKQYLDPDHHIPRVDASEPMTAPGGITFGLAGPALPEFTLAAPRGTHRLWTLGGRLDINDIAEYTSEIIASIGGGELDFTRIVGAVFPLFRNFWSAYVPDVEVTTVEDPGAVVRVDPVLTSPMGLSTSLDVPPLPAIGDLGWADALFLLGGALTVDGAMVPLGINGGADTADEEKNPPDGVADGNERTEDKDPFELPLAMLHSGLKSPHTAYMVAAVAVSIPAGDDPRPDGGSAILVRGEAGQAPPAAPDMGSFLGFPIQSTWSKGTREVSVEALDGADLQRLLFKGRRGEHWTIWLNGRASYTVPVPAELFPELPDRALADVDLVLVNSLDLADGVDLDAVAAPGGVTLDEMLGEVDRVSFIDIETPIATGEQ
ncbi:MAG: hypothetical protein CSA66_06380 [Proteobacteria bacterium]|nr:MAG: hypothetical protein CSA66_06380 [Pseudomonadota bacterium]